MADMELGKHLYGLNMISNMIAMAANYLLRPPASLNAVVRKTPDENIKFMLSQLIIIKLHCFLEVMDRIVRMISRSPDGQVSLDKTKPIIEHFHQNRDAIIAHRNKLIAHAQKDVEHPYALLLAHDMPIAYWEILLFARLADELRNRFKATYSADFDAAKEYFDEQERQLAPKMSARAAEQRVKSKDDMERELERILAEIPD